jgi:hypothetical protein
MGMRESSCFKACQQLTKSASVEVVRLEKKQHTATDEDFGLFVFHNPSRQ